MNKDDLIKHMDENLELMVSQMEKPGFDLDILSNYNVAEYFYEYSRLSKDEAEKYILQKANILDKICDDHNINPGRFMLKFYFNI